MLTVCALIWAIGTLAWQVAAVRVARHRAYAVADLAALAGAGPTAGADGGCRAAGLLAGRSGARLDTCSVHEGDCSVTVSLELRIGPFGRSRVTARARAGPAERADETVPPVERTARKG